MSEEKYEYIIGLEIHIKVNSQNKLFCKCKNEQEFDNLDPNTHVCPVCTGQPGALPVLNKEPLEKAVLLGHSLNCDINKNSYFDRKSYFYPDLPLGYQITQFNIPTNGPGYLNFFVNDFEEEKQIRVERAHIESDAGKTIHDGGSGMMDYNRAGTPLVEIVTYPDFTSSDEVVEFLKELQRRVKLNGIGDADMEKGQLRCDVNISIKEKGTDKLGDRVELKNINSFGAIKRAIDHEFKRQIEIVESGQKVSQDTRGWDDNSGSSYVMRSKEEALDYRYFPEPDLPIVNIDDNFINSVKENLVEHSFDRIKRYKQEYGFNKEYINGVIQTKNINEFFEYAIKEGMDSNNSAKWIVSVILRLLNDNNIDIDEAKFSSDQYVEFLKLIQSGELIEAHAKKVLFEMFDTGKDPKIIIEEKGLKPVDEGEIEGFVDKVLENNPQAFEDVKNGEEKAIGFLVGQVMKESQGKADPKKVKELINNKI